MGLSATALQTLKVAVANEAVGNEIHGKVLGTKQTPVAPVAVTFTANPPAKYGTPTGLHTVADGSAPTVVELVNYCNELRANIAAIQAVLHAHGLTS